MLFFFYSESFLLTRNQKVSYNKYETFWFLIMEVVKITIIKKDLPDIIRSIVIEAPIEKVWKGISSSEALAAWFLPNDFQPVLGHEFTLVSQPQPERGWDGLIRCKVMELEPPTKLGFTWTGGGLEHYVTFELEEKVGKTELTLTHAGWRAEQSEVREIMYDGWGYLIEGFRSKLGGKDDKRLH